MKSFKRLSRILKIQVVHSGQVFRPSVSTRVCSPSYLFINRFVMNKRGQNYLNLKKGIK
jgi:hypothetical protein